MCPGKWVEGRIAYWKLEAHAMVEVQVEMTINDAEILI